MPVILAVAGMLATSSAVGPSHAQETRPLPVSPAVLAAPPETTVGIVPASVVPFQPHSAPSRDERPVAADSTRQDVAAPAGPGIQGIPEITLAAYRNAELQLDQLEPGCGLDWSLLAGIGRIESGHAGGGNTDANGTTLSPILGPALDGSLPGNEIIATGSGGFVRAIGPMQFLPSTWSAYASDGNGDGIADPDNVFDATLAAGKYLCSGGLDLRDPAQRLRAVLRYNNSTSYAANVLHWSDVYRGGGDSSSTVLLDLPATPAPNPVPADQGPAPTRPAPDQPEQTPAPAPDYTAPATTAPPAQPMITIPGLPPIPCVIFCPPPPSTP
ncbi:lytic murein transglycosylase [Nocardia sp. NPDC059239]|uniref:lytic transglycosylase domain-containing protein n=1 Tax=unclassified Nocardia TaxID=2637762 RepID=UPI0036AB7EE6